MKVRRSRWGGNSVRRGPALRPESGECESPGTCRVRGGAGGRVQHSDRRRAVFARGDLGDMHAPVLGSVVLSSATSWMVLHLILGDQPLFHVPAYQLVHPLEFGIYVSPGRGRGARLGVFREAAAETPAAVPAAARVHGLVSAGGGRLAGRAARVVGTGSPGRGLRLCG